MSTKSSQPLLIAGDRLLLVLDAIYAVFEPVNGIDGHRARAVIRRSLESKQHSFPILGLLALAYVYRQLDRDGMLRELLHTAEQSRLSTITFDARVLLNPIHADPYPEATEQLELVFTAIASGELTEADFKTVDVPL